MEKVEDIARSGLHLGRRSPTLGQLLQRVGDSRHHDGGVGSPDSQVLDLDGMTSIDRGGNVPFVLTFTDLTYCVKNPKKMAISSVFPRRRNNRLATAEETAEPEQHHQTPAAGRTKTLLDSISGEARDGEILAVLGASGSGKSTLIDALAGRIARGSLKGSVTLNGARLLKTITAYVMQDDLLFPMLTVEETLTFAAEFRLPRSLPASRKKARVQALIEQLGLRAAARTIIGDEGHRGVSGGERRRVSIGTDIIHDPIILFLDEPTSGLDSTSAFMVVSVLQRIARSGSIVIMSIHQPSSRILGLIDRLLFLSRGQTVYSGSPDRLPRFFAEVGHPIPDNESLTEYALDLIRQLEGTPCGTKPLADLNRSWETLKFQRDGALFDPSRSAQSLKEAISASISRGKLVSGATGGAGSPSSSLLSVPTFANPFWIEMAVLARRSFTNSRRQPEIFAIQLATVLLTGFILATIFWQLDSSPKGVQERLGFFAFGMSTVFYTCADYLPVFIQERYIFMRETAYNAYRRSSYVLANAAVGLPPLVLLTVAFAVTTFFALGLAGGASAFIFYILIILASFWAGSGFVTFLSAVVPHVMLGYVVVVAILAYFLLFCGFFIHRDRIPDFWIWFHYLSLVKYPYEAVLQNEFGGTDKCFVRGVQMFDGTPLATVPTGLKASLLRSISGTLGVEITSDTCVITGSDVLKQQGITQLSKWNCLWVTVAWGFFFRVLFYLALMLGGKNKRR